MLACVYMCIYVRECECVMSACVCVFICVSVYVLCCAFVLKNAHNACVCVSVGLYTRVCVLECACERMNTC